MVYDKAKWHFGNDFPKDLPSAQGYVHIGMFLTWLIDHDLESASLKAQFGPELKALRQRKLTGAQFLRKLDGVLSSENLSEAGNRFARAYYLANEYFRDYALGLATNLPTAYHVADNWENYQKIAVQISRRFKEYLNRTQEAPTV